MHSIPKFNDVELHSEEAVLRIHQLDQFEMRVVREFLAVSPDKLIKQENLKLHESPDGVGAFMFFTRWTRLGIDRPASREALSKVLEWARVNGGTSCSIDLSPLAAPSDLSKWLVESGMRDSGARIVTLWRSKSAGIEEVECDYEVREVNADVAAHFGIVHRGAKSGWQNLTEITNGLVGRANWRSYVVYDGETPISCAAMFTERGISWRGIAATLPEFRGKGAHAALVARMTHDALSSGVSTIMAQTFRSKWDEPAKSEWNLTRAGFRLSHLRAQYVAA
jgi:hypothetical protein